MRTFELEAKYDSRKSFYGKARVEQDGNRMMLYSYDTLVITLENDIYYCNDVVSEKLLFSLTTLRHIKEFLKQFYKKKEISTKKDIIENNKK